MSGDEDGQVSEVQKMDQGDEDTPISDSQAVAGQPDAESGDTQEGPTGPNARTGRTARDEHPEH
jgi:hypothetical protein